MKKFEYVAFLVILLALTQSCTNSNNSEKISTIPDSSLSEIQTMIKGSQNYLKHRDMDGDGIDDKILFDYSGGAHCCYTMSLYISSLDSLFDYPFEMDGGYEFGMVDGSQPKQFNIEDYDGDGLPEIFMEISSYNGNKYSIETEWTEKYGFKTNEIFFDFANGTIYLKDFNEKTD